MSYLDAGQYDTNSTEWRDICLARWICAHDKDERARLLVLFKRRHGEQLADLAREQWGKRAEWMPAHVQGEAEHGQRHRVAEVADRAFRETFRFQTHAEILAELALTPSIRTAAAPRAPAEADDDILEFGTRKQTEPPPFELTA